uniref:RING-type E3 ubiquitin transferase n=1 Tax=Timema cristinae TaxID=61476 RepID=A0A7R9CKV8_TIMCR|nr:unnamed protein product [Timema cristinae]
MQSGARRDTKMATLGVSTLLRNEFSRRLSQLLECPACHNYMVEDIYQCVNGDSICSSCKKTMAKCPTCSGDFVDTRCLFAEKIAQEIYYPCKNVQTGCQEMLLMKDRTYHELNCLYRLYSCIKGNKCEWKGTLTNLIKHIEESHKFDSTEDITAKFWNYTTNVDSVHELSVFTQGELFLCVRVYKSNLNKHLFYVTHVGIKENSDKFRRVTGLFQLLGQQGSQLDYCDVGRSRNTPNSKFRSQVFSFQSIHMKLSTYIAGYSVRIHDRQQLMKQKSQGDVVFDCCAHAYIGGVGEEVGLPGRESTVALAVPALA